MHFTVSPATYFTAAYERILFSKHSSGSAIYLLQSHSRQECRTSTGGLEDADVQQRRLRARRAACNATRRVNIGRGAGKKVSGSRAMDLFVVVIIAAMLLTVGTVFLGVLTMSAGGSTDNHFSTPLMWARIGFSALTLLLLFIATRLR
jgi:hypothetical protein